MALEFADICHAYGHIMALDNIALSAAQGEITCLLGPSGCGKTTLLQLAAGLLDVQAGEIRLNGDVLASPAHAPPPESRPIGLVFQEGALFPHMTVARNIAFGVADRPDRDEIVGDLLARVGLADFANRYPHTLSGGQQQRVALARALAPAPAALLLDEPFANVDIVLRRSLREETRRVLKDRGAISILVTHDPEEAMEIGDTIAIMEAGKILQAGSPSELYDTPVAANVGALIGDGQIISARRQGDNIATSFGSWSAEHFRTPLPNAADLELLVRPEGLNLDKGGANALIVDVRVTGPVQRLLVRSQDGDQLSVLASRDVQFSVGEAVNLTPKRNSVFAFAKKHVD